MSSAALIFDIIFSSLVTLILLYRCGNFRRQHPLTTIFVFLSWFFTTLTVFILPLDISLATYRTCLSQSLTNITTTTTTKSIVTEISIPSIDERCPRPWSYVDPQVYRNLWLVIFWTSQILTWLVLPMMQSISETGEFSIKGKIIYAIKINLIFYGSLLLIFLIIIIYMLAKKKLTGQTFLPTMITASNTWGLFLLVLMLGYGLVQVPLNVYHHSRTSYMLSHTQFRLSKLYNEKVDIEERLDSLVDKLTKYFLQIRSNDVLRPMLEKILAILPELYQNRIRLTMDDQDNHRITTNYVTEMPIEKELIRLHGQLKANIHTHHRVQVLWTRMIDEAFFWEDMLANEQNSNREYHQQSPMEQSALRKKLFQGRPKLEWYTFCFLRPWSLRLLAVILAAMSLIVIWSEMTFFSTKVVLSIFAKCVEGAWNRYNYFFIEIFSLFSIGYLCLCAYYTVFRIRVFNYFYVSLYHLTDETSLIFTATVLCRLISPLCYNYLGMIHLDQAITERNDREETLFTSIMGHLVAIPIVSIGFNFYFPMLICVLSIGTYFRLGSRCLHACGFRQFFDDDELSAEYVEDGKSLMVIERRNYGSMNTLSGTTTATQRRNRREELAQKYGLQFASSMTGATNSRDPYSDSETRPLHLSSSDDEPLLGSENRSNRNSTLIPNSSHRINRNTTASDEI